MDLNRTKYSYEESKQALDSRIQAHRRYSNFSLHEWIKERFKLMPGDRVIDLGCGDGNFTRLFWDRILPNGFLLGLDKNIELLNLAEERHSDLPKDRVQFILHDFDTPLPCGHGLFDLAFAIYSLYYSEDSWRLIQEVKKRLHAEGRFVVIGPGPDNIKDLTAFNYRLTGQKGGRERINRIAGEFLTNFNQIFSREKVQYKKIDSQMRFPTPEAFAEYYWSTLLWRESIQGKSPDEIRRLKHETLKRTESEMDLRIKKQVSVLIGRKGET